MTHHSPLVVRLADEGEVDPVKAILDGERAVFGFIPRPALEDARRRKSLLVVLHDERVIGFASIRHRRDRVTTLGEIVVVPELRAQGIGRALIQAVIDEAARRGQHLVRLKCPVGLPANAFYARLGFTLIGQEPGKRVGVNVWSLALQDRRDGLATDGCGRTSRVPWAPR